MYDKNHLQELSLRYAVAVMMLRHNSLKVW